MAKINNLEDLLAEKYRLEAEIRVQKEVIREGINSLQRKLNPVRRIVEFFQQRNAHRETASSKLKAGTHLGIDMIAHRVLSRASWVTRFVVPLVAKRISSVVLDRFRKKKANTSPT